jgi:hypothetical protein
LRTTPKRLTTRDISGGLDKRDTNLYEDIPISVLVECVSVQNFVLGHISVPARILGDEFLIWIGTLWVLVEKFHVRMCRRGIQIVVQLLHILAMISLMTSYTKQALLKNRILPVPYTKRETKALVVI